MLELLFVALMDLLFFPFNVIPDSVFDDHSSHPCYLR